MDKEQRLKYEMFVRVRAFETVYPGLFDEGSLGSQAFSVLARAVEAIDDHLTKKVLAAADARKVKAVIRAAVREQMKIIAHAARRMAMKDAASNPFRIPTRKSDPAMLSTARAFIEAAGPRQAQFIRLGLPPDFVASLQRQVEALELAVDGRRKGRFQLRSAQAGVEAALEQGFDAIRDLDVVVPNAVRSDPVRLAAWQGARRVEGGSRSSGPKVDPVAPAGDGDLSKAS
ncbi:MAG: hypothetical protein ABI634_11810 [Acidobacteriota bacterium]